MEEQVEKKETIFEIYPSKVGRRVLAYLADIFISLIVSTILFELVIFQISRPISNYDDIEAQNLKAQKDIYDLLYERELLFFNSEIEGMKYNIDSSLEYSASKYIEFYVFEDEELKKYDIFNNYYVNYYEDEHGSSSINTLNNYLEEYGSRYFDLNTLTPLNTYSFKEDFKEMFSHNYIEGDEMSANAKNEYENFINNVFLPIYNHILTDIRTNNLISSSNSQISYLSIYSVLEETENKIKNIYVINAYISFFITTLVLFLVIPLTTKKKASLGERVLKLERINKNTLGLLDKKFLFSVYLFKVIDSLTLLMFIPFIRVGFTYLFSMNILFIPSLMGLLMSLINLALVAFTKYNTSLKELTTNSIVVDSQVLDEYYLAKYGK